MVNEEVKKGVTELIQTFSDNINQYKLSTYKEAQVRKEFIDKFFKLLGWDIDNEQRFSEQFKEVINEDAIKIEGNTKAPDYAFRIGGQRIFFVEAKKPSVKLRDNQESAYQLRRYAWNVGIPISILTDFEEFAVYDCRVKPNEKDNSSVARIMMLSYKQYLENFDKIWDIFSKEAALKYRFGWKKSERIHYYSEFLGMKDTITEEDMLIDVTKTEIEKRLTRTERENEILQEKLNLMEGKMGEIQELTNEIYAKMNFTKKEVVYNTKSSIFYQDKKLIKSPLIIKA